MYNIHLRVNSILYSVPLTVALFIDKRNHGHFTGKTGREQGISNADITNANGRVESSEETDIQVEKCT